MTSLVLHAPSGKARQEGKKSFDDTVRDGIGDRYAIGSKSYQQTRPGCRVVILDKDKRRRAEGTLVKLEATEKTVSGMQRYDVYIRDLTIVPYKSEDLTRTGIAVIE
ncbi:MAG: hypothetical protein GX600_08540 [Dehalococcoidia bacterium]|nr:hypothetical protein [Dehalococcoidia bacterium]